MAIPPRSGGGGGGPPATRAGWEIKLQQLQEDLERREAFLTAQEQRIGALQAAADDLHVRESTIKAREQAIAARETELVQAADEKCRALKANETYQRLYAVLEAQRTTFAEEVAAFTVTEARFQEGWEAKQAEQAAREAALREHERRLATNRDAFERQRAVEDEKRLQALAFTVADRVTLAAAQRQLEQQIGSLKAREDAISQAERLNKELAEHDDKTRRMLKTFESDLKRRLAAVTVSTASLVNDQIELDAAAAVLKTDRAALQHQRDELLAQASALHAQSTNVQKQARDVAFEVEALSRREIELRELTSRSEAVEAQAAVSQRHANELLRRAALDGKRLTLERIETDAKEKRVEAQLTELQGWHQQLAEWSDELEWRESQFALMAVSASPQQLAIKGNSVSPTNTFNRAVIAVQMDRVKQQYEAGLRRRASAAMHPLNRSRPGSAALSQSAPVFVSNAASSSAVCAPLDADALGVNNVLHRQERAAARAAEFKRLMARLVSSTEPEARDRVLEGLPPADEATIRTCLARERDVGAELRLRAFIATCPFNDTGSEFEPKTSSPSLDASMDRSQATGQPASPTRASRAAQRTDRAARWWVDLQQHLQQREEQLLDERITHLDLAIAALRKHGVSSTSQPLVLKSSKPPRPGTAPAR
jgi:hypothetical protein